ncbi:MAG: winged helix-turn-helix transcriptional regulator [Microthrixaceae bacterium]
MSDGTDLDRALRRIGDRWSLLVVDALRSGPRRYGELARSVPGIAPNVLARRLRDLEADGLVVATPYQERPVRMAYGLTADGRALAAVIDQLAAWAAAREGDTVGPRHDACGTALELRWWCPTCARTADGRESDGLHRL